MSVILVTAAILTVQWSSLSMLQPSYAQLCPDGSTPDASGTCPTLSTPPADEEETAEAPPPATTETPPPPATEAPPAGASQGSNNTGNATGVDANSILAVYNRERAAAGVPLYFWNDTLAAHAQTWVDYLAAGKTGGKLVHCTELPGYQQIEECSSWNEDSAEALAMTWPGRADPVYMIEATWMQEKPGGHYLGIVTTDWKSFGCGFATSTNMTDAEGKPLGFVVSIVGCRYR